MTSIPRLRDVLTTSFPNADPSEIKAEAEKLYNCHNFASSWQSLERSDIPAEEDIVSLSAASKSLKHAARHLRKVGWHGGKTLHSLAGEMVQKETGSPSVPVFGSMESGRILAEIIERLSRKIATVAQEIDPESKSYLGAADDSGVETTRRRRGPRIKSAANDLTAECANVFRELSGVEAALRVDPSKNVAYGPFLDFLTAVFGALDVEASPEGQARKLV